MTKLHLFDGFFSIFLMEKITLDVKKVLLLLAKNSNIFLLCSSVSVRSIVHYSYANQCALVLTSVIVCRYGKGICNFIHRVYEKTGSFLEMCNNYLLKYIMFAKRLSLLARIESNLRKPKVAFR